MSRNGSRHPPRPRIELTAGAATAEEAAAIAGAIEQFIRDTAPPAEPETTGMNPWLRAALYEGVGHSADTPALWS